MNNSVMQSFIFYQLEQGKGGGGGRGDLASFPVTTPQLFSHCIFYMAQEKLGGVQPVNETRATKIHATYGGLEAYYINHQNISLKLVGPFLLLVLEFCLQNIRG